MSWSTVAAVIATVLLAIAGVMIVTEEPEFAGLAWQGFGVFGLMFLAIAHWIPGGP